MRTASPYTGRRLGEANGGMEKAMSKRGMRLTDSMDALRLQTGIEAQVKAVEEGARQSAG